MHVATVLPVLATRYIMKPVEQYYICIEHNSNCAFNTGERGCSVHFPGKDITVLSMLRLVRLNMANPAKLMYSAIVRY